MRCANPRVTPATGVSDRPARRDFARASGRRGRAALGAAALLVALALTGCRAERLSDAAPFCEAPRPEPVVPPVYTFDGQPLNLNRSARQRVDRWVAFFRERRPDLFERFVKRSGSYEAFIREALRADGLPEEFLYLAMIESGFDPNAYSRSHAVGLWQFLASTGSMYGLEVGTLLDERRHPVRSTGAAITYLSDLHEQFGDWLLAAAAYNGGPGRLRRAIRRSGTRDYWELVEGGYLPRETSHYVPKIVAAAWLGTMPGLHGFGLLPRDAPQAADTVRLFGRNRLSVVAAAAGVEPDAVAALNPWLVADVTPAGRWTDVRLPAGARKRFEEVYAHIPSHHRSGTLAHRIRPGETLGQIARDYGVTLRGLVTANPSVDPRRLRIGEEIRVPAEVVSSPALARSSSE